MSDFLSEVDRHILARANFIPRMITDPVERENVELLFDLLRQHVDHVAEQQQRIAELEQALRAIIDGSTHIVPSGFSASAESNPPVARLIDYEAWMAAKKLLEAE